MTAHQCQRCGKCCAEVGRTFWKHGNLMGGKKPFGDVDELNGLAANGEHQDDGLPCEMMEADPRAPGKFLCKIHRVYGFAVKPAVCQSYPEQGEECFRQEGQ
jgi:hypothetical protein